MRYSLAPVGRIFVHLLGRGWRLWEAEITATAGGTPEIPDLA
jgi:hypothetical protein